MKLITIQDTIVEEQLTQTDIYVANFDRAPHSLKEPYHKMSEHYGWNTCPVFCGVVGKHAEFYGAKTENAIAFQLDVPDKIVKIQAYYDWTDFIYFTEIPNEFHDSYDCWLGNPLPLWWWEESQLLSKDLFVIYYH